MARRGLAGDDAGVLAGGHGVVPVRRQDQLEDGVQGGDAVLKIPGVLLHVGPHGALVFVGDDGAGIGGGRVGYLGVQIDVEHAVLVIADLGDLVVAQGVGVAIGRDAPHMERAQLAVAIDGNEDGGEVAALWAKDFDDAAFQQRGFAVRLDGEGLFVVERHRHGGFGIIRRGGMRGGEHPVRRLRRACDGGQSRGDREARSQKPAGAYAFRLRITGPVCRGATCRTACARSLLLTSSRKPLSLSYSVACKGCSP